jgi:hypothetical protein
VQAAQPQEPPQAAQPGQPAQPEARRAARNAGPLYRVDLTTSELEGGTRLNSRSYSLLLRIPAEGAMLRVGSRLPLNAEGGVQYMNVGLNIDLLQVDETDGKLTGTLSLEMNSVVPPEPPGPPAPTPGAMPGATPVLRNQPIVRDLRMRAQFALTPGKPAVVGTIDDVNSKRRFQIEMTATRL